MKWYYAQGGKQMGPVEESELENLVRQGTVRDDTLVWREGMASWQRHSAVRGGSGPAPAAPPPPPMAAPANDPRVAGDRELAAPRGSAHRFGGFWMRFLALVMDGIIIGIVSTIVRFPLGLAIGGVGLGLGRNPDPFQALAALPAILSLVGLSGLIQLALSLAYEVYFLSTKGATPGKMALGLSVIRADGSNLSPGLATGRYFARFLGWMTLGIGFIIAGFDREKRSLHDHICGTRVIYSR